MTVVGTASVGTDDRTFEETVERDRTGAIQLFKRYPVAFVRGSGSRLWDSAGKEYLDFLMGIGVCGLGHCHPRVVAAVQKQVETLMHVTNLFYIPSQATLVEMLHERSGGYLTYLSNSGSEANECALKLAKKYGQMHGGRWQIITALNSFHGRTIGTISATGQEKVRKGFGPLLPGFTHVPYNDLHAIRQAITPETAAVMLEVVHAESSNIIAAPGYLEGVRRLCDEQGVLLIFDEVQTGIARSGSLFAWQLYGVRPDIFTLAKALGNGVPVSACLGLPEVASAFQPGDHGGTYGGNPVACAAAIAVLETIDDEKVLDSVRASGKFFLDRLHAMTERHPLIKEVRGVGLILALELNRPVAKDVVADALAHGFVINATTETTIRLRPALNVQPEEIDRGLEMLEEAIVRTEDGKRRMKDEG
ncbi:MAG TPA: aspartate aminotransferase family protein [Armatimonadota bacterium]|nr:aspartate aminotransferase family protein [Armatimonadota bacterium]